MVRMFNEVRKLEMENLDDLLLIMSPSKTSIVISIAIKTRKLDMINAINNENWRWKKKKKKKNESLCASTNFLEPQA